jgi:hypothetical protein
VLKFWRTRISLAVNRPAWCLTQRDVALVVASHYNANLSRQYVFLCYFLSSFRFTSYFCWVLVKSKRKRVVDENETKADVATDIVGVSEGTKEETTVVVLPPKKKSIQVPPVLQTRDAALFKKNIRSRRYKLCEKLHAALKQDLKLAAKSKQLVAWRYVLQGTLTKTNELIADPRLSRDFHPLLLVLDMTLRTAFITR